jgi:hypothetical protein
MKYILLWYPWVSTLDSDVVSMPVTSRKKIVLMSLGAWPQINPGHLRWLRLHQHLSCGERAPKFQQGRTISAQVAVPQWLMPRGRSPVPGADVWAKWPVPAGGDWVDGLMLTLLQNFRDLSTCGWGKLVAFQEHHCAKVLCFISAKPTVWRSPIWCIIMCGVPINNQQNYIACLLNNPPPLLYNIFQHD